MDEITLQIPMFPVDPDLRVFRGCKGHGCPHCGEQRTTDSIYGVVTFLCGFSRRPGSAGTAEWGEIQATVCQGDRYECYVPEESVA